MRVKIGALVATVAAAASAASAAWAKRGREPRRPEPATQAAKVKPGRARRRHRAGPGRDGSDRPGEAVNAALADGTRRPDDITTIKGIGPGQPSGWPQVGVTTWRRSATWSESDIDRFGEGVKVAPRAIRREDWVGQARAASSRERSAERAARNAARSEAAPGGVGARPTPPVKRAAAGRRCGATPVCCGGLAVAREEGHHVLKTEAAVPPLADTIERQLTTVAEALDRVDMQVEKLGDFARGEHRTKVVGCHGRHLTFLISRSVGCWTVLGARVLGCSAPLVGRAHLDR